MKLMFKILCISMIMSVAACSSGPGVNRQQFFDRNDSLSTFPAKIGIDEESRKYESGAIMGEGAEMQAFIVGGLPAMYLLSKKSAVGGIRGNFSVGDVFYDMASRISLNGSSGLQNHIDVKLNYFQQYIIPGLSPRLKAIIEFSSHMKNADKTVHSAYLFDWESQGPILSPDKEKDMLREMVEQVITHWSSAIMRKNHGQSQQTGSAIQFPDAEQGQFSGNGVQCKYHIFYTM